MYKLSLVLGCKQKIITVLIKTVLSAKPFNLVTYLAALNLFHKYYLPRPFFLFVADYETSIFR